MRCPLLQMKRFKVGISTVYEARDCLKEECAWWHEGLAECSVYLMQEHLAIIFGTLLEIEKKMPHE